MPLRALQVSNARSNGSSASSSSRSGSDRTPDRLAAARLRGEERHPFDDEFRFFRTWIEKPLSIGAVTPSGKALARMMAAYVDPACRARSSSSAPAPAR